MEVLRKVLVVEDDPVMRLMLEIGLTRAGYQVLLAEHGLEAQEKIIQVPVDAIILDVNMPVLDGLSFLDWLRNQHGSAVPVVICTSSNLEDIRVKVGAILSTGYMVKPFDLTALLGELDRMGVRG